MEFAPDYGGLLICSGITFIAHVLTPKMEKPVALLYVLDKEKLPGGGWGELSGDQSLSQVKIQAVASWLWDIAYCDHFCKLFMGGEEGIWSTSLVLRRNKQTKKAGLIYSYLSNLWKYTDIQDLVAAAYEPEIWLLLPASCTSKCT